MENIIVGIKRNQYGIQNPIKYTYIPHHVSPTTVCIFLDIWVPSEEVLDTCENLKYSSWRL
jgi:hypothetical protein